MIPNTGRALGGKLGFLPLTGLLTNEKAGDQGCTINAPSRTVLELAEGSILPGRQDSLSGRGS